MFFLLVVVVKSPLLKPFFKGCTLQAALQAAPCRPLCKKLAPWEPIKPILSRAFYNRSFLGRRPKPALFFLIAEKEGKKASTPGSHKIYFYTGILQLPTVGQVKCLYHSVKNKFYRRLQRGARNGNSKARRETAPCFMPFVPVQELVLVA